MIKYAVIKGYFNCGEISTFSHMYQFLEVDKDTPMTILVHAYDITPAKAFKGFVFHLIKTWSSVPLTPEEIEVLTPLIGEIVQVGFTEFSNGTIIQNDYKEDKVE